MADANEVPEITPIELSERIQRADDFDLIDVREPYELRIGHSRCAADPAGHVRATTSTHSIRPARSW